VRRAACLVSVLMLSVCVAASAIAQPGSPEPGRKPAAGKNAKAPNAKVPVAKAQKAGEVALTPGREAAALTFARLHHPELADLLDHLKDANRKEYQRALRELFQASERLARLGERSPERYELSLAAWKIDSRIRLLAARMTMTDDPALEDELKAALEERLEIRLAQHRDERARTAERLETLNRSIEALEGDREAVLARELEKVKRGLGGAKKSAPRPAGQGKAERPESTTDAG
jgi:hypothetical protein